MEFYEPRDDLDNWMHTDDSNTGITPLQSFYHKTHIFITGGSGFIGKVLIEKLLRSCDVEKIYLLLRTKKGKKPEERIKEQFTDELFSPLKQLKPNFLDKIQMIPGDIENEHLGISEENTQLLIDNVNIVIHGAATLSMDDPIEKAFNMNIRATKHLLDMFEKMPNKKSFSYVSTAYCHAHRLHIDEKFYPTSLNYTELEYIVKHMDTYELAYFSPKLIGAYSNSYSYSKALAEEVCREYVNKGLPVGIVRPSIVVSTYQEPIRAWINNIYGATGVLFGASLGFLHVFFADPNAKADLIPVDMFANTTLASIWEVSQSSSSNAEQASSVYNCVSSPQNPVTWNEFKVFNEASSEICPVSSNKTLYAYSFGLTKSPFWFHTRVILTHVLPAIIIDQILKLNNKQPMLLKAHRKVTNFLKHFHHYAEKDWVYTNDNVQRLWNKLTPEDRRLFFFNCQDLEWIEFYNFYLRGIKKFVVKEASEFEDVERSEKRTRRNNLIHMFVKYGGTSVLTAFLGYITLALFS